MGDDNRARVLQAGFDIPPGILVKRVELPRPERLASDSDCPEIGNTVPDRGFVPWRNTRPQCQKNEPQVPDGDGFVVYDPEIVQERRNCRVESALHIRMVVFMIAGEPEHRFEQVREKHELPFRQSLPQEGDVAREYQYLRTRNDGIRVKELGVAMETIKMPGTPPSFFAPAVAETFFHFMPARIFPSSSLMAGRFGYSAISFLMRVHAASFPA